MKLLLVGLAAIVFVAFSPVAAQPVQIVSTDPAPFATSVPLSDTISFHLNKEMPAYGSDFSKKFFWSPLRSTRLTSFGHAFDDRGNLNIIFFRLDHSPQTDYTFVAYGIASADGRRMAQPFVLNYTTASTLGQNQVDGSVTIGHRTTGKTEPAPELSLSRTVVLLLKSFNLDKQIWDAPHAAVPEVDGSFTVQHVRDGEYWPLVIHFADSTGEAINAYGYYDPDGDHAPNSVSVQGGSVSGIDLTVFADEPFTSSAGLDLAREVAGQYADDQQLQGITSLDGPVPGSVFDDGTATYWRYSFFSPGGGFMTNVFVDPILVRADTLQEGAQVQSVPSNLIDSPAALAAAEANGGSEFRAQYEGDTVRVHLEAGYFSPGDGAPDEDVYWLVEYQEPQNQPANRLQVFVDAVTGEVRTAAEGDPLAQTRTALHQNYPNPFRATTTIDFELSRAGHVKLTVFDMLGRQIALLVDKRMETGPHQAVWNAEGYPSGAYLCRLEAGGRVMTRTLVLVK